ncbi:HAMP domain-containing protein [Sphingomonas suaedae]|uniref:histidine kinase n=1 Tax=Sphingomonas suaedae TaxID=2599297 RepID=A0A518RDP3_9SPHN|nr:ATP-binding protein [Sphingomonas suaedae]QDX25511.1 HAMP domain-containing protein [Sphingomonas suaedae]
MSIGANLSLRIAAILLGGFVLLQLLIASSVTLPGSADTRRPYSLPRPDEVRTMVAAIERTPAADRLAVIALFDQSLYHSALADALPPTKDRDGDADLRDLAGRYRSVLPGREVVVWGSGSLLRRLLGNRPRSARLLAPVNVAVRLSDGRYLVFDSRPSATLRRYLRGRSIVGAVGGLILLAVLLIAVRRTTGPLVRLARGVRGFSAATHAPDLPEEGPREVRAVAAALNEMKRRIIGLIDQRTAMLAAIAHDMRTYLTRLRLRSEFIGDPDQQMRANRDLDEMAGLLDDTLILASGRDGRETPAEPVDLRAVADELVTERCELGEKVMVDGGAVPLVLARRVGVRRILSNLIDNGLRHGSEVRVTVREEGDGVLLSVEDDGPGLPEAALARLGEPFARLDPSRDRESGGAGLGLAIVKALAARDAAEVRFANRRGGGLKVTLHYGGEAIR